MNTAEIVGRIRNIKETVGETAERFQDDQLRLSNLPRTVAILGITGVIAAVAANTGPEPIRLSAIIVAAHNFTFLTILTMEGWGRIGDYDDMRNRESKPGTEL